MKVTELYFHMVLFIMLIMDDSSFHDYEWNFSVTIQMKATELYFHVVMFITLIEKILSFTAVKEIIVCDHSNEAIDQYFQVIFLFILLSVSDFQVCGRKLSECLIIPVKEVAEAVCFTILA